MISAAYSRSKGALGFVTSWMLSREGQTLFLSCTYWGEPEEQTVPAARMEQSVRQGPVCAESSLHGLCDGADILQGPRASITRNLCPWQLQGLSPNSQVRECVSPGQAAEHLGISDKLGQGNVLPNHRLPKRRSPQAVQWKRWGVRSSECSQLPTRQSPKLTCTNSFLGLGIYDSSVTELQESLHPHELL